MTDTTPNVPTSDLTGKGELYDPERRYVAITLTDELRDAIYREVRAHGDTTPGLLLRDIVAAKLGVTIDIDRAASRTYTGTPEEIEAAKKAAAKERAKTRKEEIAEGLALLKAKKAAEKAAADSATA